jgi:hypothetical protein
MTLQRLFREKKLTNFLEFKILMKSYEKQEFKQ